MIRTFGFLVIILILDCTGIKTYAQHSFDFSKSALAADEDSLIRISDEVYLSKNNAARFEKNTKLIKTLVNALKTHSSFNYGFDSLKNISIVHSPDKTFRIFSWQVPADDGTYRFFGTIQLATKDGSLKLFPLIDDTENFKESNQLSTGKNWYGARYYDIIPLVKNGKPMCYALLGWKGNTAKSTKKVIEILSFDKDQVVFGKTVFEGSKDLDTKNRIVFEYNKLNSMTLLFDREENMIIFDHLAPLDPAMTGNFEYYASDLSFDAYKISGGKLKLIENVEPRNDPNEMDELYIDPTDKEIPVQKKF